MDNHRQTGQEGISRRRALGQILAGAGAYVVTASTGFAPSFANDGSVRLAFPQGLASGDPQPDGVVLWTRAVEPGRFAGQVRVRMQLAHDEGFLDLVHDGVFPVNEESDYCLRILIDGLAADTRYFFRFGSAGGEWGPLTGRTRTAPAPDQDRQVRFAFASCQSFENYYFGAWRRMVEDDRALPEEEQLDFVLHLGDFIYEGTKAFGPGPRQLRPFPSGGLVTPSGYIDAHTVEDYRQLYKMYLADPDLQAARARFPFVCTWDDHEFSNDGWQAHGTYFKPGRAWPDRKVAANQAWFEFIPALLTGAPDPSGSRNAARDFDKPRVTPRREGAEIGPLDQDHQARDRDVRKAVESMTIYRAFRFGRHVDLILTDNRSYRSGPPLPEGLSKRAAPIDLVRTLDAGATRDNGKPPETVEAGGKLFPNPRRDKAPGTVLGPHQKAWFKQVVRQSTATWKLWANSIPLTALEIDMSSVAPDRDDVMFAPDGWDGYDHERRELMMFLKKKGIANVVSLAGDHHMHMASTIPVSAEASRLVPVMTEFATASVTSRNFFESFERLSRERNPQLRPLVTFEHEMPDGSRKLMENLNLALTHGTRSAGVMGTTGQFWLAGYFRNPRLNRHLGFVDTASHGFGLVRASADRLDVDLVCTGSPAEDYGKQGAPEIYRANFFLRPRRETDTTPDVKGPFFEGLPPFPYAGWDGRASDGRRPHGEDIKNTKRPLDGAPDRSGQNRDKSA